METNLRIYASQEYVDGRFEEYGTPEDIVQQVIAAIGTPVFGRVDENNNIILTGELVNGTYTLKYEDAEGNVTEIGTLTKGNSYTNMIPLSVSSDGSLYNGGQGWQTGYRLNSSGAEVALDGMEVTGFIPVTHGDYVYMKNVGWKPHQGNATQTYLWCYDSNFNCIAYGLANGITLNETQHAVDSDGNLIKFKANGNTFYTTKQGSIENMAYFRLNCESITADSIITVNEPIE